MEYRPTVAAGSGPLLSPQQPMEAALALPTPEQAVERRTAHRVSHEVADLRCTLVAPTLGMGLAKRRDPKLCRRHAPLRFPGTARPQALDRRGELLRRDGR